MAAKSKMVELPVPTMWPCGQQPILEHLLHSLLANTDFPKS